MIGVIYKYTSPSNKVYIGQTVHEKVRYRRHRRFYGEGSLFHKAIEKYGFENFTYEVVASADTEDREVLQEQLNEWEKYYIKLYNSFGEGGYNLTEGGQGSSGTKHTKEYKDKMSERMKENNPAWNMTDEWRKNIGDSARGRKMSDEQKKKISERMKKNNPMKNPEVAKKSHSKRIGTHLTDEQKRKISECQKGKIVREETKQKLKNNAKTRSRDSKGHFIKEDKQ